MTPCILVKSAPSAVAQAVACASIGVGTADYAGGCYAPTQWGGVVFQSGVSSRRWRRLPVTGPNLARARMLSGLPVPREEPALKQSALVAGSEVNAMTSLVELFAAAILTLSPNIQVDTATRYATDIENAVDADLELGMAIVVTMNAEATARPEEIEHCIYKAWEGDRDGRGTPRALGLYQLHFYWWDGHDREEICASHTLQAILVAKEMRSHIGVTRGNWHRALRRHVGFNIDPNDPRVINRPKNFDRVVANARRAIAS